MQDAWRAYLELALGLTEASRKKAQKVAKKLVGKGGVTAAQLQALAEDLVSTSLANREALSKLVRFEVDRTLGRVGLATAEEVADLTARVRDLEEELRQARATAEPAGAPATDGATVAAATVPVAKKAIAKKAVAKKTVAKKAADAPPATATAPVKKAVAKKAVANKAAAKKAVAKKATSVEPAADAVPPTTPPAKAAPAKKAAAPRKTAAKKTAPPAGEAS
ncbi:phasin family protein [Phytohabitans sp. LJ34]|uniref:phasin family protein n=1 Tax=Phytohabitans sp. LJ34 TaxID=3452217 RepID=UPI003F88B298